MTNSAESAPFSSNDARGGRFTRKFMTEVGVGKGDYEEVTVFRYVGPGQGEFGLNHPKEEPRSFCEPTCCCVSCFFLVLALLALLVWLAWPIDENSFQSLADRTQKAFGRTQMSFRSSWGSADADEGKTTTHASAPLEPSTGGIEIAMLFDNFDLDAVHKDGPLWQAFQSGVYEALTKQIGHGMGAERITLAKTEQSGVVRVALVPPCGTDLPGIKNKLASNDFSKAVVANLKTLGFLPSRGDAITATSFAMDEFGSACEGSEVEKVLEVRRQGGAQAWKIGGARPAGHGET